MNLRHLLIKFNRNLMRYRVVNQMQRLARVVNNQLVDRHKSQLHLKLKLPQTIQDQLRTSLNQRQASSTTLNQLLNNQILNSKIMINQTNNSKIISKPTSNQVLSQHLRLTQQLRQQQVLKLIQRLDKLEQ